MIKESVFCRECGSEVPVDSDVCLNCGNSMRMKFELTETIPYHDETIEKNNRKKRIQIIVSILAVLVTIASIGIKVFIIDKVTPEEKAVNDFVRCVTSYKPGVYQNKVYSSETFGLRINFDSNWEVKTDGLEEANKQLLESVKLSQAEDMRKNQYDEKLISKVIDNSYAKIEIKATTLSYGGADIRVYSNFGINERNMEQVVGETKETLVKKGMEVTKEKTTICDKTYYVLKCTVNNGSSAPVINEIYMRAEYDMVIMISCYYQQGYEEIKDNFINSISEY